jgi:hypothetical protein
MSDKDDDDSHPTSPPLTLQQQPSNLASSLVLNQLPLNEILKDMRFGYINPKEIQSVSVSKHAATCELLNFPIAR